MTPQETFDKGAIHLLTQNEKSIVWSNLMCAYRGPNNLRCAAGAFIPDDKYNLDMEACSWIQLCNKFPEALTWGDKTIVYELQQVHDGVSPKDWPTRLIRLAHNSGLSDQVVKDHIAAKNQ